MILGIDVGATSIAIASFDAPGKIIHTMSFPSRKTIQGKYSIEKTIQEAYHSFLEKYPFHYEAIGIGVVGQTDHENGIWLKSSNLQLENSVVIKDLFDQHQNTPIILDNDVNAATMAELSLGKGVIYKDFIYINLGSGIAAGLVSNRRIIRGSSNYAGELAYIKLKDKGNIESLESVVSGIGIQEFLKNHKEELSCNKQFLDTSAVTLFRLAEQGNIVALQQLEKIQTFLYLTVHNLVNILNPEAVIFGGSLAKEVVLLKFVEKQLLENLSPIHSSALRFVGQSELGVSTVGVIGAAQLAFNALAKNKENQ